MLVTVFGSFVVDLMARTPHLPVAGETVKSSFFLMGPGGKGFNQAIAARRAGCDVAVVTKLGQDSFAEIALDKLRTEGMSDEWVIRTDQAPTGNALIIVDETTSQNEIVVSLGACDTFSAEDTRKLAPLIAKSGLLLTQLETNVSAVEQVVAMAKECGVKVVLNPAPVQPISDELYKKIDVLTPNEVEASILTGVQVKDAEDASKAAAIFMSRGVKNVVVTLGSQGVFATDGSRSEIFKNYEVPVVDSTGAGDAFSGGLVTALAEGKSLFEACAFGNAVANLSVTKLGTSVSMPSRKEIDLFIKENE